MTKAYKALSAIEQAELQERVEALEAEINRIKDSPEGVMGAEMCWSPSENDHRDVWVGVTSKEDKTKDLVYIQLTKNGVVSTLALSRGAAIRLVMLLSDVVDESDLFY